MRNKTGFAQIIQQNFLRKGWSWLVGPSGSYNKPVQAKLQTSDHGVNDPSQTSFCPSWDFCSLLWVGEEVDK